MDSISEVCLKDVDKICRICTRSGDLEPLENLDIDDIKNIIPSSSTEEGNELPIYICKNCFKELKSVLSFISKNKNAALLESIICDHDYQSSCDMNKPCNMDRLLNVENASVETGFNFLNSSNMKQEIKAEVEAEQNFQRNTVSTETDSECQLKKPLQKKLIKKSKTKGDRSITMNEERITKKTRGRKRKYESIKILIEDIFQCSICEESFLIKEQLDDHYLTKHIAEENSEQEIIIENNEQLYLDMVTKIDNFQCEICNNKFTRKSSLKTHVKIHTGEKSFECPFPGCECRFISKGTLNRHLTVHSKEKQFMCYYCGKCLTQKAYLARHIQKIHSANGRKDIKTEKPKYSCLVCGRGFYYQKTLELHKKIHKNIDKKKLDMGVPKPFLCPQCGIRFSFKCNLDRHSLSHTGIKPFECNICGDKFTTKMSLQCHINIHANLTPYHCERCPKKFRHPSSLRKHILVHTGERHFKCELCKATFKRSNHLNVHFRRHLI